MSKEEFPCDMCNYPMDCVKTLRPKETGKKYRIRTFKCPVCGYQKDIYGRGGYYDGTPPATFEKLPVCDKCGGLKEIETGLCSLCDIETEDDTIE